MKSKRQLFATLAVVSTLFLSACGSSQINSSLTQNINYSVGSTSGVEDSSITVKYSRGITGPNVVIKGKIRYDESYESTASDIYKKNLKTIAVLVRDIGGIDKGKIEVVGQVGDTELIPGIVKDSDKNSVSLKDLLSE